MLARHGLRLREDVLGDEGRALYAASMPVAQHAAAVLDRLEGILERLAPTA